MAKRVWYFRSSVMAAVCAIIVMRRRGVRVVEVVSMCDLEGISLRFTDPTEDQRTHHPNTTVSKKQDAPVRARLRQTLVTEPHTLRASQKRS